MFYITYTESANTAESQILEWRQFGPESPEMDQRELDQNTAE